MLINTMPRYEILDEAALAELDRGWRRIVSEIGIQFAKPEAVELFRRAGQRVDGDVVKFDPEFVLEQVAKAVAFARFLKDNGIPIDFSWMENYNVPFRNTPLEARRSKRLSKYFMELLFAFLL